MGWFRSLRRGITWVTLGAAGGAVIVTARHLLRTPQPLESVLSGEARIDRKHGGDIFYNVAGPVDAEPLVLLHDFASGASNFEFRAIFEPLAQRFHVYAPDWLGFGMSERPHLAYTGEFYASVLSGFLRDVVGRPATILAHGLAANVAVRAASDSPELFARLVLVSPDADAGEGPQPTFAQTLVHTSQRVSLGLLPYALVSSKPVLRRLAGGGDADEEQVEHLYASAHQFGGQHAVLALFTGALDLPIRNALPLLEPPLLLVCGAQDPRRPRETMEDLAVLHPRADLDVIPNAGDAVFDDQPGAFVTALTEWMGMPAQRQLIDESALLPPMDDMGTPVTVPNPADSADEMPTIGDDARASADTGEPGSVVPGVSDIGLDGPAVVTFGGVGNFAPDASGGAEDAAPSASSDSALSAAEDLPEAGAASPANPAERAAREGVSPPVPPDANIAARGDAEARREPAGQTEGELPTSPARAVRATGGAQQPSVPEASGAKSALPEVRTNSLARSSETAKTRPLAARQRPQRASSQTASQAGGGSHSTSARSQPKAAGGKGKAAGNAQGTERSGRTPNPSDK
jgi:pimeloyl-ACP methyl ester carboxylesterase